MLWTPQDGQVWEFLVEGLTDDGDTLDLNRIRYSLKATVPNTPILGNALPAFLANRRTNWLTIICPLVTGEYSVPRYSLQGISRVTPRPGHPTEPAVHYDSRIGTNLINPDVGTRAGNPNPSFVTATARWLTQLISRNTRGGIRLSPISDDDVNGETLAAPYYDTLSQGLSLLRVQSVDTANNATWTAVIFSGKLALNQDLGAQGINASQYAQPIIGQLVSRTVGSQLHRKPRPAN